MYHTFQPIFQPGCFEAMYVTKISCHSFLGIETYTLDVTNRPEVEKVAGNLPNIDVLLNIAGIVYGGNILENTEEQWDKIFNVNVKSMFHTCQVFLPKMLAVKSGVIINMASVASSHMGVPNRCIYSSTKGAVVGLTKSMAADFVKDGIRVNCICPGKENVLFIEIYHILLCCL